MAIKDPKVGDTVYVWSATKGYQIIECQITAIREIHNMLSHNDKTQYVLEDRHGEYAGCYCLSGLFDNQKAAYDDMIHVLKETVKQLKADILDHVATLADLQKDLDKAERRLDEVTVRRSQIK